MEEDLSSEHASLPFWKQFIRKHVVITLLFLAVLYSFLGVFYYRYFTRVRSESFDTMRLIYEFADFGITFSGPSFHTISKGDNTISFKNNYGEVIVNIMETDNTSFQTNVLGLSTDSSRAVKSEEWVTMNGKELYMRLTEEPGLLKGKKEYFISNGNKIYSISTTAPGMFRDLDFLVESIQFLEMDTQ